MIGTRVLPASAGPGLLESHQVQGTLLQKDTGRYSRQRRHAGVSTPKRKFLKKKTTKDNCFLERTRDNCALATAVGTYNQVQVQSRSKFDILVDEKVLQPHAKNG